MASQLRRFDSNNRREEEDEEELRRPLEIIIMELYSRNANQSMRQSSPNEREKEGLEGGPSIQINMM